MKTKVLIAGSSGLIGSALVPFLQAEGFAVGRLLRSAQELHPYWDIKQGILHLQQFTAPDIVINLAGKNIADSRWSNKKKQQIMQSRICSTQLLADYFSRSARPPKLFINASAIGFYGDRGEEILDEQSAPGRGFVSDLAERWEEASQRVKNSGCRLVNLRSGLVLSRNGGILKKMLPAFKLGLGGKIGSGRQFISWIDIDDILRAVLFIINTPQLQGPVNLVAPNPVSNLQFSRLLAEQLKRPCLLPLPEFLIKLLFAEMGKELLLAGCRVHPEKLTAAGFEFKYARLEQSLLKQLAEK